ncbi:unnamed protein product [Linum tenue]|uniref:Uncharacterized protein n=1 Tax=Linum tenue TaxID=586396 RepID=A0AAV0MA19_9ROSI|nr:unnamed protein product [Linum tenue]
MWVSPSQTIWALLGSVAHFPTSIAEPKTLGRRRRVSKPKNPALNSISLSVNNSSLLEAFSALRIKEFRPRSEEMGRAALLHLIRSPTRCISSATNRLPSGCQPYRTITWLHHPNARPSFTPAFSAQKRWASQAAAAEEDDNRISIGPRKDKSPEEDKDDEDETGIVYRGPISSTIKKVKMLSLSTCCLSVSLGPVITFMTSTDSNVILKGAVASSVIFFSASTTAALHWFVSPYIHRLRWQPGSDSFEVDKMSWLATFAKETIRFADIRVAETNRPFVSFMANGKFYFVDKEHCHNKALLARLTPQTRESAFKNL